MYHPIDEFHLQICPTAIGSGRALFPNRQSYSRFELVDVRIYDTGVPAARTEAGRLEFFRDDQRGVLEGVLSVLKEPSIR